MMEISTIVSSAAIIILIALQNRIFPRKSNKAKMALLIPISFIYVIAGMIALIKVFPIVRALVYVAGATFYPVVLANILLLAGYIVIKFLVAGSLRRIKNNSGIIETTAGTVYEYSDLYDTWFLRKEWTNFRTLLGVLKWGFTVASVLLVNIFVHMSYAEYTSHDPRMALSTHSPFALLFPVALALIFCELHYFMDGVTKEEFEHSIGGSEADARRLGQYFRMREIFEKILPDALLSAQTGFELQGRTTSEDYLKKLKQTGLKSDKLTADYFLANDRYMNTETDMVKAIADIMRRQNTVIFNPFYRDLDTYLTLPLTAALFAGRKCIVVTGRLSSKDDVNDWISGMLSEYTHMPSLWRVSSLSTREGDCEVGILSFQDLYNSEIIKNNQKFLRDVDLVLMLEPSAILSTGQIALNILAGEMEKDSEKPVYIICDRMVDGLVDTVSHLFQTNFTEVTAAPVPRCIYTGLSWASEGDYKRQQMFGRQTKYLGNGIELSAIALKNQIPKTCWYSEKKMPLKDIRWIAGQYYPAICQYMNQMASQTTIYERMDFVPNLWSKPQVKEHFAIVEDEFNNIFTMMRTFLNRGRDQSFVNVMSDHYLLRDYMRFNQQMFLSDPNAVPSLVTDYAKTERNTLFRLLLTMVRRPVKERELIDAFHLVGCEGEDAFDLLTEKMLKYTGVSNAIIAVERVNEELDDLTTVVREQYSISERDFQHNFATTLAKAFYILEEEEADKSYVDARFFGHVMQNVLPGQFVTYDGKYYVVKHMSPQSGVVLRRASDLIDGRKFYRQSRKYQLQVLDDGLVNSRKIDKTIVSVVRSNITVDTDGYLEMTDLHDLNAAKRIDLSDDPAAIYFHRSYINKNVLKIHLPGAGEEIRLTLSLLLMELFRTVFPDGYQYLCVTTPYDSLEPEELKYIVSPIAGADDMDAIYVIEDSDIDLGLIETVEKNIPRLMGIIADFLEWHGEKLTEPDDKTSEIGIDFENLKLDREEEEVIRKFIILRLFDAIVKAFGGKKPKPTAAEPPAKEEPESKTPPEEPVVEVPTEDPETEVPTEEPEVETPPEEPETEAPTEEPEVETPPEEPAAPPTKYQKECFLTLGYDAIPEHLDIEHTLDVLVKQGWKNEALAKARKCDELESTDIDLNAIVQCDFCGRPLSGVSYELLNDGRIRCNDCAATAIETIDEFKKLFYQVTELMEAFYGIKFRVPISVATADAKTIAKGSGRIFRPTGGYDPRTVGYAQKRKDKYNLIIENGSPRLSSIETMSHELTHIWQYLNWNDKEFERSYNMGSKRANALARLIVYEGMAVWASIQYLYQIGETKFAAEMEKISMNRRDVYGVGFILFCEEYPLIKDGSLINYSPFRTFPPIDPARVREIVLG